MKILITVFITVILGLLIMGMQDPVFMSTGSDSLDVVVLPESTSQSIGLILFFFSMIHILIVRYPNKLVGRGLKSVFFVLALTIILSSGHSYTISGKQNAFIDQWFHIPVQKLEFDPVGSMEKIKYIDHGLYIFIYDDREIKQVVLTGFFIWGVPGAEIIKNLQNFGVMSNSGDSANAWL